MLSGKRKEKDTMKIITHEDIINMKITPLECCEWAGEVIKEKKKFILPPKISLKPREDIFYNTMPSILPEMKAAGVKVVNRYPQREPSLDSHILLYDLENGNLKALLDGNFITTMRTGAVAAHSVKLFAKKDFKEIGLIGLGNTMRAAFTMLLELFPEREVHVKVKEYKNQHEEFIKEFAEYKNVRFEAYDTYEKVIEDSDVIMSSVTYAGTDFCEDKYFKEGCCLVPIHTRGFTNCDLFFDKIYADDTDHVRGFKNFNKFRKFAEVTDVVNGKMPGRENDSERILAYNIGISIQDLYFAEQIYKKAENTMECSLDLEAPKDKFWVTSSLWK